MTMRNNNKKAMTMITNNNRMRKKMRTRRSIMIPTLRALLLSSEVLPLALFGQMVAL